MMSKLMREELWKEGTDPIIRIVAKVCQSFGAIKIQSLCEKVRVLRNLEKLGFLDKLGFYGNWGF